MNLHPRESVLFAEDFDLLVRWYRDVLGLTVAKLHEDDYHYANLENAQGVRLGIADAKETGITPHDRPNNSAVIQFAVDDVKAFFERVATAGGAATFGPSFDENGEFWFGGIQDVEGNPVWIVDTNCP